MKRFAAIQDIEPRLREIESTTHQVAQQLAYHGGVFGGPLSSAQNRFPPVLADA